MLCKEFIIQIFPLGILAIDQIKFLLPCAAFDLLLTCNGFLDRIEFFVINELCYIVATCKTWNPALFLCSENSFE